MSEKKIKSPYKAVRSRNSNYSGYVSMNVLTPNKAYKIVQIKHTTHPQYGEGEQVSIEGQNKEKYRVQLPGKYLKTLDDDQISRIYKDISKGDYPYIVYRGTLPDKSFNMDLLQFSIENEQKHKAWANIPEMEDSISESDSSINNSNSREIDPQNPDDTEKIKKRSNPQLPTEGSDPKRSKKSNGTH